MSLIALACSVPVALIGAYYLVNASAVNWLGNLEGQGVNRIRVRLRRVNGVVLLLMSVALYLGVSRLLQIRQGEPAGLVAPLAWIATLPLLLAMLVLAMLDVRLTRSLKRNLLREAAMKTNQQNHTPSAASSIGRAGQHSAVLLAALLGIMSGAGCEESAAQGMGQDQAATRSSGTTRPTTMRSEDLPRENDQSPQRLRMVKMKLGEKTFMLQVADTDAERQAGLMFRRSMPEDEGMIFVFPDSDWRSFWMKNTFIPLDIAFVDESGMVLNVEQMAAHDLRGTDSVAPAKWVIELGLGVAEKTGLEAGMKLDIPESAREAID